MKLVSLGASKKRVWNLSEKERREGSHQLSDKPIMITAQLSRNQYEMIQRGDASIEVPEGVTMNNRAGSKTLEFNCENEAIASILVDGLDNSGMVWDEDFETTEVKDFSQLNE